MTLTVRLDATLETALERYCATTGSSKSHVVQESLATYLLDAARPATLSAARSGASVSDNFRAFAEAGLVGGVAHAPSAASAPTGSADKAGVRAHVAARAARALARRTRP